MRKTVRFSAINAKIDNMSSKLLKDDDYIKLCHLDNLSEIISYLQDNTEIGKYIGNHKLTSEVEKEMQEYKIMNLEKLTHYLSDDYKKFVKAFLYEYEISDIKKILRVLQKKEGYNTLASKLLIMNRGKNLNIDSDVDIPTFIKSLKNTRYYRVLQSYQNEENDVVLFYMEMNLDKLYYTTLINASKSFSEEDRRAVKELLGRKIDLLNITWIYRGLKYYKLLPEELINFCVLGGCKLGYDDLKKLCYVENLDNLIKEIKKSDYAFLFDSENTDIYMDRRSSRYLYYIAKKEFSRSTFNIGKFLSYVFLLDFEVKDISAIMETMRFKISFDETLKYLVRSYKGSEI